MEQTNIFFRFIEMKFGFVTALSVDAGFIFMFAFSFTILRVKTPYFKDVLGIRKELRSAALIAVLSILYTILLFLFCFFVLCFCVLC